MKVKRALLHVVSLLLIHFVFTFTLSLVNLYLDEVRLNVRDSFKDESFKKTFNFQLTWPIFRLANFCISWQYVEVLIYFHNKTQKSASVFGKDFFNACFWQLWRRGFNSWNNKSIVNFNRSLLWQSSSQRGEEGANCSY